MKFRNLALTMAAALAIGSSAFAAVSTDTMSITYNVDVTGACTVYAPDLTLNYPTTFTTITIEVSCPASTSYALAADAGGYYDGTWRNLYGPSGYIPYAIWFYGTTDELGDIGYGDTYTWGYPYYGTATGGYDGITFDFQVGDVTGLGYTGTYTDSVLFSVNY